MTFIGKKSTGAPISATEEKKPETADFYDMRAPRYHYDDLILPDGVLHDLDVLQSMIENHHLVYNSWGMDKIDPYGNQTAFSLYGPPGTGKTMIVEALCYRWQKPLIDINLSGLESKYVGETGKNIVKAFAAAKKNDAVLFFDEADTVLGKRLSHISQSADASINTARGVMLKQLEQHTGIVAFATNFVTNYDPAFIRRILKHIFVPLPDAANRGRLWRAKIPQNVPGRDEIDFETLSAQSDGLSGGEILVAVKNALFDAACSETKSLSTDMLLRAVENAKNTQQRIISKKEVL